MMKETNTDGKTVKADLTQDDIKSFRVTIAPLKENGMLKAHLGKDEDGKPPLLGDASCTGIRRRQWPNPLACPGLHRLNKWQLHSSRDKVLVNGYCQLINASTSLPKHPYTKEGQEAKNSKKGHAQHGLIQILADINGDNRKMSLKKSDGQGVNPATSNRSWNHAEHQRQRGSSEAHRRRHHRDSQLPLTLARVTHGGTRWTAMLASGSTSST